MNIWKKTNTREGHKITSLIQEGSQVLEESQEVRRAEADKAEESAGWRCGDWGSQGWEGYAGMENITLLDKTSTDDSEEED